MRAIFKDADLPLEFWDEAIEAETFMKKLTYDRTGYW